MSSWKAHYWQHGGRYELEFDTSAEAWRFLEYGSEEGTMSPEGITSPTGEVFTYPFHGGSEEVWEKLRTNQILIPVEGGVTIDGEQFIIEV